MRNVNKNENVKLKKKRRMPILGSFFLVLFIVLVPVLMVVKQIVITNLAINNKKLAREVAELKDKTAQLNIICESLQKKEMLENLALNKFGMVYPSPENVIIIDKKKKDKKNMFKNMRFMAILNNTKNDTLTKGNDG